MISQNTNSIQAPLDLKLHTAYPHKKPKRWEKLDAFVKEYVKPIYGSQKKLFKCIQVEKNATCRLLYANKEIVGVLIYQKEPREDFAKEGFPSCMTIELFHVKEQETDLNERSRYLLQEAIKLAEKVTSSSISLRAKNNSRIADMLVHQRFRQIAMDGDPLFIRKINDMSPQVAVKRPLSSPSKETVDKRHKGEIPMTKAFQSPSVLYGIPKIVSSKKQAEAKKRFEEVGSVADRCSISNQYLQMIKARQKTIECRINAWPFINWKVGQFIEFFTGPEAKICEVTHIETYPTFEALLQKEDYRQCVPNAESYGQALQIYHNIPGYKEKAQSKGVLAIHIRPL